MLISILTLFPEMFQGPLNYSILKRAQEKELVKIELLNIRDSSTNKHKTVDDRPYGGGGGMIIKVDVIDKAIKKALNQSQKEKRGNKKRRVILLDPQGTIFNQKKARRLSKFDHLVLICGHYEGVDERVRKLVDEEVSVGDFILTGGEIPAMLLADAVVRLIPGVLEKRKATQIESFTIPLLEYPQYTRPPIYGKQRVPRALLSGNHAKIKRWRKEKALKRTQKRRPDLASIQKG